MKFKYTVLLLCACIFCKAQIIDGYTNKSSYSAGETITFFTKSFFNTLSNNNMLFFGRGSTGSPLFFVPSILNSQQLSANINAVYSNGLNYVTTGNFVVPASIPSFVYLSNSAVPIPLIIKANKATVDVVIVYPTNTENAYCKAGGKSGYPFNSSQTDQNCVDITNLPIGIISPTLSFNRQLTDGDEFINAFADGFLNWVNSGNRFGNNTVGFIADADMDDYSEIANAKLLIIIGHSEYWTRQARQNFDKFVDAGKNALILSGNSMWWQVRLQPDPTNANNPQIVCNKYNPNLPCVSPPDDICDPLLLTNNWNNQGLKYSTLGSIGSDWGIGGFSGYNGQNYPAQGFGKHKVLLPNSPLLNGVSLQYDATLNSSVIDTYVDGSAEVDGILVKGIDNNGNPVLDKEALGFYQAELIAYDKATYLISSVPYNISPRPFPFPQPPYYTGIMAMQKTCASGKIINVNCNEWCRQEVMSKPDMQGITQNMINLLTTTNANIFTNPVPTVFKISPATNNVSYQACTNGSIKITPCGVTLTDGYKVDATNAPFYAKANDCSSCNRGARFGYGLTNNYTETTDVMKTETNLFIIYPNPTNEFLNISFLNNELINLKIELINNLGQVVLSLSEEVYSERSRSEMQTTNMLQPITKLNVKGLNIGIYILKITNAQDNSVLKIEKVMLNP